MLFFCGGFGVDAVENLDCVLLGGVGERLGGESMLSRSFWLMPGGNGNLFRLLVVNVTIGGLGGSTDFRGTRLLCGLNLDIIVLGAGTGIGGMGGGGTDMLGRIGVGGIGGTDMGTTGADTCDKTVDAISDCGSGGGGGGGGCTPGAGAGKFGLCDMAMGQLLGGIDDDDDDDGLGEVCIIA